jgi:formate dehydrogenase maturation protein FdhE
MLANHPPPKKRNKYCRADERFVGLVNDFDERNVVEFLHGIAHNQKM